jgi:hypothetical protein
MMTSTGNNGRLGIELHCGCRTYARTQELTDEMTVYHGDPIHYHLEPNQHFSRQKTSPH